ncbi:MAG: PAS domain-containing protein, partial [Alkalispirochaetaceae bacterium]
CRNDPQWSMLYANKRTRELTGYDPEDFYRGEVDLARLIHPEDRDRVYQEVQIAIDHRTPFHLVYRLRSEEGTMELRSQDGTRVDITIPLSG